MKHRRARKRPEASPEDRSFFVRPRKQADLQRRSDPAFFQEKLTVGRPGDRFEKEADATADAVVSQSPTANDRGGIQRRRRIQRQGMEEEEPQAKVQRAGMEEEEPQAKVQRQAAEEEEPVQAKHTPGASSLSARIEAARGKGRPLPAPVRREMEEKFEADFTRVRIHTGVEAAELCEHLRAEAFTRGSDIFFNHGRFNPNSQAGRHLLAHELTHVIQQTGAEGAP